MANTFNRNDGTFAAIGAGDIGGTGFTTAHAVLLSETTGFGYAAPGASGTVLTSTGTTTDPTFQAASTVTLFSPNVQTFTATSGTYTTPTNGGNLPLYIKVTMTGGGAGGSSGGTSTAAGTNGSAATFGGGSFLSAGGGQAASGGAARGGIGGRAFTIGVAVSTTLTINGGDGGSGMSFTATATTMVGGVGGSSFWGGGGRSGSGAAIAGSVGEGYGSGGGGGATATSAQATGAGGGAGGTIIAWLTGADVKANYAYNAPSSAGTGNTGGANAGGDGMDAVIVVEAFWQ